MRRLLVGGVALLLAAGCYNAPGPGNPQAQCDYARWTVAETGDQLPAGWDFRCPDPTWHDGMTVAMPDGHHFVAIGYGSLDDDDGGAWLLYVTAHESCHARGYAGLEPDTWDSEQAADACAARYGFARP